MDIFLRLRQLKFCKEFRIYPGQINTDLTEELTNLGVTISDLVKANQSLSQSNNNEYDKLFAEISTNLWRLKNKMIDPKTKEPFPEMRRGYRNLDSMWISLEENGIKIIDHTGEEFIHGKSLKALAFEPADVIIKETVIDTIKPSIFKNKLCIQMGEVIVGTPIDKIKLME